MTLSELLQRAEAELQNKITVRKAKNDELVALRSAVEGGDTAVTEDTVKAAIEARNAADVELRAAEAKRDELRDELVEEERVAKLAATSTPTGSQRAASTPRVVVTGEARTYAREADPAWDSRGERFRAGQDAGAHFLRDVAAAKLGDWNAQARLNQHMQEERTEREGLDNYLQRAVGTGAFAGLVVPQYLTDLYAPAITTQRPFADICRKHDLPATGMNAYIGRVTTGTSVADQANEGDAVANQDIDDTLLTVSIRTAAGQQTMSRQSIERGLGTEDVTIQDLMKRYAVNLDTNLLNAATSGLTNVATAVTYTDASPTGGELYPKLLQALAGCESSLLGNQGDCVVTMTSTRWYWLQSQLTTQWPLFGQPGIAAQNAGVNYATKYGAGFRGLLPNGAAVVVDNNIATNLGGGTNQDEIYITCPEECHLWEDASAPLLIRADQPKAANLQVLLVVYGYYAFTYGRLPHAQKISGTGLTAPTF